VDSKEESKIRICKIECLKICNKRHARARK
jgi:hypothetical protein